MAERRLVRRAPSWLGAVPISIAFHAAVLLALASLVRTDELLPVLTIDLNAIVAEANTRAGTGAASDAASARVGPRVDRSAPARAPSAPTRGDVASRPPVAERRVSRPEPAPAPMPPTPQRSSPPAPLRPPADGPVAPSSGPTPAPTPPEQPPAARETVEPPRVAASARTPSPNPAPPATSAARDSARREDGGAAGARTATDATGHAADGVRGSHGRGGGVGAVGGDRLALAVPGSGDGGPGTEYGAYLSRLRERLQQTLRYPPTAQRRGITGTVQLDIAIEPDGAVSSVSLASSSSHDALDRAALDAARALGRQPFPADVRARPLEVRVPVTFRLQ